MKTTKIKKSIFNESGIRFDASYHLSDGPVTKQKLNNSPYQTTTLSKVVISNFKGNIFKRSYVDNANYGFKFLTASDMMKIDINGGKYISKKYTKIENLKLDEGWLLISRSGTLGNIVYTNSDFKEIIGTDDLIRVIPDNKKIKSGYLYAFLASKFGYGLITQSGYGGVVQHIEPHHIEELPIPLIPEDKQSVIHDLIINASILKVEANKFLEEAVALFKNVLNECEVNLGYQFDRISSKDIFSKNKRFDSQYHVLWKKIKSEYKDLEYIKINDLANNIFVGGRGKRNYVASGTPFLSSSDMMLFNPLRSTKYISNNTPGLKSMKVEKYDILISRSGTVGNTIIVGDSLNGIVVSEHALRLKIDSEKISPNYVFAFLKTETGKKAMEASSFGSVIITLNEDLIGDIDIPILDEKLQNLISEKVENYINALDKATNKENQAIDLIEKEIDAWQ